MPQSWEEKASIASIFLLQWSSFEAETCFITKIAFKHVR